MKIAVFSALGLLLCAFAFVWLVTRIRYRIGSRHVKVLLFGLPIRRIALGKIDSISKRRGPGLAEHWVSTMRPKHRILVIRKKSGLFKNVMLTPKNRYIFKTELERAMQRAGTPLKVSGADAIGPDPEGGSDEAGPSQEADSPIAPSGPGTVRSQQ